MNYQVFCNRLLDEKYYFWKHESGLRVYVCPKKGFNTKYAIFGTKFGSINNEFKFEDSDEIVKVPDGTAHFLEHKLFEKKNHNAFDDYAKTGASANAYTSFEKTAYLFSCSENFFKSLKILLDFVQKPYFTKKSIEKEQGIIGQEIQMYQDSADWKVLINLLKSLYEKHPVNIDTAGSIDSIAKITPKTLYDCYNAYYTPSNMSLCICGDLEPDKTFSEVNKILEKSTKNLQPPKKVKSIFPEEPRPVKTKFVSEELEIFMPIFNFGFKERMTKEYLTCEEYANLLMVLQILNAKSSNLYKKLLDEKLINTDSYSCEIMEGPYFLSVIFSGESNDPKKVTEIISSEVKNLKKNGFNEGNFMRAKKTLYGGLVSGFDSVSGLANRLLSGVFTGREIFTTLEAIKKTTLISVNKALTNYLNSDFSALSVISSKKQ